MTVSPCLGNPNCNPTANWIQSKSRNNREQDIAVDRVEGVRDDLEVHVYIGRFAACPRMTAVQFSPHGNARQFSPQPSRDIASRPSTQIQTSLSSQNRHPSLSNGTATVISARESAAAHNGLVVNGNADLSNASSSQNPQLRATNGINGDDSAGRIHVDEQNSRPVIRRSKSNRDGRVNSGAQETALGHGESVSDDSKDWGARHGFEEHYEQEYVAQLANVSCALILFGLALHRLVLESNSTIELPRILRLIYCGFPARSFKFALESGISMTNLRTTSLLVSHQRQTFFFFFNSLSPLHYPSHRKNPVGYTGLF